MYGNTEKVYIQLSVIVESENYVPSKYLFLFSLIVLVNVMWFRFSSVLSRSPLLSGASTSPCSISGIRQQI